MSQEKLATKLVNICAWCGKEQYGVFDDSASTSHGMCDECFSKLREVREESEVLPDQE